MCTRSRANMTTEPGGCGDHNLRKTPGEGEPMRKIVLGILCLFTVGAFAQSELPRFETYLGYSFTRVNSGINVPAFSANGGLGEFAVNFNKWFAGVGSFNAVHNGNIHNLHVDQTVFG